MPPTKPIAVASDTTEVLPAAPPPATPASSHPAAPAFAIAVRGYDRAQVDDYLAQIHRWLREADRRTASAEDAANRRAAQLAELQERVKELEESSDVPAPRSMAVLGQRVGDILQSAVKAADDLRSEAAAEVASAREGAVSECDALLAKARAEADEIFQAARRKEETISQQIDELAARKSAVIQELGRLRSHLASILEDSDGQTGSSGARTTAPQAPPGTRDGANASGQAGKTIHKTIVSRAAPTKGRDASPPA